MVLPYTLFSIDYPKITLIGAFGLVFLFDIVLYLSLLDQSFFFRSWSFSSMLSCKVSKQFGEEKYLLVSAFFHFSQFFRGLKVVFVVVTSVPIVASSSYAELIWLPHFVFMTIKNHRLISLFRKPIWSFRDFTSILLSSQCAGFL